MNILTVLLSDDVDWTVSVDSHQSALSEEAVVSSSTSPSMSVPVISVTAVVEPVSPAPVPPPRFKKLRRQSALTVAPPVCDDVTTTSCAQLQPVLPDDSEGNAVMGSFVSRESSLESPDERNAEDEEDDDMRCSISDSGGNDLHKCLMHHESTQSLTSETPQADSLW